MRGKIHGKDHHGARPNEGVNTIEVGSTIIQQLQQIHTLPYIPASVKMTNYHAVTDNLNVIPVEATFGLDLRAQDNDVMDDMKEEDFHIINSLKKLYDIKIDIEIDNEDPAAIINEEAESNLNQASIEEL